MTAIHSSLPLTFEQTFDKFNAGVVPAKDLMPLMQMCGLIPTHADIEKVK